MYRWCIKLKDLENKLKHLHEDFKEISRFCTDTDGKKLVKENKRYEDIVINPENISHIANCSHVIKEYY